jgi:hypothetical protein
MHEPRIICSMGLVSPPKLEKRKITMELNADRLRQLIRGFDFRRMFLKFRGQSCRT